MLSAAFLLREGGIDPALVESNLNGLDTEGVPVRLAPWWVRIFWPKGISAMTPPWVIWVGPEVMAWEPTRRAGLIVHELTHTAQWKRLGWGRFLYRYLADYLKGRRRGMSHRDAYRAISLEREAEEVKARVMG